MFLSPTPLSIPIGLGNFQLDIKIANKFTKNSFHPIQLCKLNVKCICK
jgi:hypothetical protein